MLVASVIICLDLFLATLSSETFLLVHVMMIGLFVMRSQIVKMLKFCSIPPLPQQERIWKRRTAPDIVNYFNWMDFVAANVYLSSRCVFLEEVDAMHLYGLTSSSIFDHISPRNNTILPNVHEKAASAIDDIVGKVCTKVKVD